MTIRFKSRFFGLLPATAAPLLLLGACSGGGGNSPQAGSVHTVATIPLQGSPTKASWTPFTAGIGGDSSGGGPSVVCRDANHEVVSARLLDLYEGEVLDGLKYTGNDGSIDQTLTGISSRLGKLDQFLQYDFDDAVSFIRANVKFLPEDDSIGNKPNNFSWGGMAIPVPLGCAMEYVAYYQAAGSLVVVKRIYEKLSSRDQAALFAHESLYKIARFMVKAADSDSTRHLNAYLFADGISDASLTGLLKDFVWARAEDNENDYVSHPVMIPNDAMGSFHLEITPIPGKGDPKFNASWEGLYFECVKPEHGDEESSAVLQYGYESVGGQANSQEFGDAPIFLSLPAQQCQMLRLRVVDGSSNIPGGHIKLSLGEQVLFEKEGYSEAGGGFDTNLYLPIYHQKPSSK